MNLNHSYNNNQQVESRLSVSNVEHSKADQYDEGLTLETSAFESLYGGQFTLSTQMMKPNYLVILPTDAARGGHRPVTAER